MNNSGIMIVTESKSSARWKERVCFGCLLMIPICTLLLLILPEARNGLKLLADRLFSASEAVNTYVYERFAVPEGQSAAFTLILLGLIAFSLLLLALFRRDPLFILGCAALLSFGQIYFGLSLPAWLNGLLYGFLGFLLISGFRPGRILIFLFTLACAAGIICVYNTGVDPSIEELSEDVRDRISGVVMLSAGLSGESASEPTGTRHINSRSFRFGEDAAETDREYRLVKVEEEQISQPDPLAVLSKAFRILAGIMAAAFLILPAARFLRRRNEIRRLRKACRSDDIRSAVCAMFRFIIFYLRRGGFEEENLPLRNRIPGLREEMPGSYMDLYEKGVTVFEEAVYSDREPDPDGRAVVQDLLDETKRLICARIGRKGRIRLILAEYFGEL